MRVLLILSTNTAIPARRSWYRYSVRAEGTDTQFAQKVQILSSRRRYRYSVRAEGADTQSTTNASATDTISEHYHTCAQKRVQILSRSISRSFCSSIRSLCIPLSGLF